MSRADKQVNPSLDISEHSEGGSTRHRSEGGMTLLEHAAVEAMKGFCAAPNGADFHVADIAKRAVLQAKALIAELEKVSP